MKELAKECMFEEIIIYGDRDVESIKSAIARKLNPYEVSVIERNEYLEHDIFVEAVQEAVAFYRDEAGGSRELEGIDDMTSWEVLEVLPSNTAVSAQKA